MNFSVKEILIIVIFLALVVAGFFYWQDETTPEEGVSEEILAQQKIDCVNKHQAMTEDDFFEAIKDENLSFPDMYRKLSIEELDERMHQVDRARIGYLVCKIKYEDESFYEKAIKFITKDTHTSQETQDSVMAVINQYKDNPDLKRGFLIELALGDINEICPDRLIDLCLNEEPTSSVITYEEWCLNICNDIERYSKNTEEFNKEIVDFNEWSKDIKHIVNQYRWRSSMALRVVGKELALKVCDSLDEDKKNNCQERIEELENLRIKNTSKCEIYSDNVIKTICK